MSTQAGDGQILDQRPQPTTQPLAVESSILINAICNATATDSSPWMNIESFSKFALEVMTLSGDGTYSLQLVGSLSLESPDLVSLDGFNLGSAITEDGITFPTLNAVRWLQAQLTISGTATVNCNVSAIAP